MEGDVQHLAGVELIFFIFMNEHDTAEKADITPAVL